MEEDGTRYNRKGARLLADRLKQRHHGSLPSGKQRSKKWARFHCPDEQEAKAKGGTDRARVDAVFVKADFAASESRCGRYFYEKLDEDVSSMFEQGVDCMKLGLALKSM